MPQTKRLTLISKNWTNPAYHGAFVGARGAAASLGATVAHVAPEIPDDVEEQCRLIDSVVTTRPDAIMLMPAHATRVGAAIQRINRAGIPLVIIVSQPEEGEWIGYVSTDSEQIARDLGRATLARLPRAVRVAIVEGHPDAITTPQRRAGFESALREQPDMQLVDVVRGDYQRAPAREAAAALLRQHGRLDAFLVANDLMALGVLEALDAAGRTAIVASINGSPEAVAKVREGRLVATALFNTHRMGALAAEMVLRRLRGERTPARLSLPADVIVRENAAAWDMPYEERELPAWDEFVARYAQADTAHRQAQHGADR